MIICGTGHRPDKLGGYSNYVEDKLKRFAILNLEKLKPTKVISGMALGWDTAIADAAVYIGLPFIAAIPFLGQEGKWSYRDKQKYKNLLNHAESVNVTSEGSYAPEKMQIRNKWMVDNSDGVLALWDGTSGGTANCLKYAKNKEVKVINVWESWKSFQ